jgi:hypothetical protein
MITASNYLAQSANLPIAELPEVLRKGHDMAASAISKGFYEKSDGIKKTIDLYLEKLNQYLASRQPAPATPVHIPVKEEFFRESGPGAKAPAVKEKPQRAPKPPKPAKKAAEPVVKPPKPPKPIKAPKAPKPAKEPVKVPFQEEHPQLATEVGLIRRYVKFHNKRIEPKQVTDLMKAVERAILERKIRKASPEAEKIEHMRSQLRKLHRSQDKPFTFLLDNGDNELVAASGIHVYDNTVPVIKRFLTLYSNPDPKKAESLKKAIVKAMDTGAISDKNLYFSDISKIYKSLKFYVEKGEPLEITRAQLNGLAGIAGLEGFSGLGNVPGKTPKAINSMHLQEMEFEVLPLRDAWYDCLGDVITPFSMMIYGGPGSGKSTFAIAFANYLAEELNKKVLYVAAEEAIGATLQEKFRRMDAFSPNITIATTIDQCCSGYDFVFIDSVNELQLTPEKVSELIQKAKDRNISLILIYRGTKGGSFRGEETNENLVDISLKAENGIIAPRKNRFGGTGSIQVYE